MIFGGHLRDCDLYGLLRICPTADDAEIRRAYRQAALAAHPDKGGSKDAFHRIATAFNVLSCPAARTLYDRGQRGLRSSSAMSVRRSCRRTTADRRGHPTKATERNRLSRDDPKHVECGVPTRSGSIVSALDAALTRVSAALRAMDPNDRRTAITSVDAGMRLQLISFMKQTQKVKGFPSDQRTLKRSRQGQLFATKRVKCEHAAGLRTIKNASSKRYRAHVQFSGLHLRTEAQNELEIAIDHQLILLRIRQKVLDESATDKTFWDDPTKIWQAAVWVIGESGTTEARLGLCAVVRLRASHWLGPRFELEMPAMPLEEAARCHGRFFRARADSWDVVRADLIQTVQLHRRLSQEEAESWVDMVRRRALADRFAQATRIASHCIGTRQPKEPGLASKMRGA